MQKSARRKNAKRLGTNWGEEDGVDGSQGSSPGEKCPLSQQEPCRHPTWTGAQRQIGGNRPAGKHREGVWKQQSQKVRQIFGSHFFISLKPPHKFLQGTSSRGVDAEGNEGLGWGWGLLFKIYLSAPIEF